MGTKQYICICAHLSRKGIFCRKIFLNMFYKTKTEGEKGVITSMNLRKLETGEHGKTRKLWEEVFSEDSREFLDYYYYIKTKNNAVYVIEEDDAIRSMLQLNPYELQVEDARLRSEYIIGVATQKEYRSRGYMRQLLITAMQDLYDRKDAFTFLMPEAEAIYTPYDFRYVYRQPSCVLKEELLNSTDTERACLESVSSGNGKIPKNLQANKGMEVKQKNLPDEKKVAREVSTIKMTATWREARMMDATAMAEFFQNHFAVKWDVCAVHDAEYYRTMILEQQSEFGGVCLLEDGRQIKGMFAYAMEEGLEIREALYLDGYRYALLNAVKELRKVVSVESQGEAQNQTEPGITVYGCMPEDEEKETPLIMVRILHLPTLLQILKVPAEETLNCSFAVIDPILQKNSRVWKLTSEEGEEKVHVSETEDSEGMIPIAELTELLFGYRSPEELKKGGQVILAEHLQTELEKIKKLSGIMLNEIV